LTGVRRKNSPISTAPATSQNVARKQACLIVSTPEPTLVPNELATSFAPIPNARMKAMIKPMMTSHNTVSENGSMTINLVLITVEVVVVVGRFAFSAVDEWVGGKDIS
jgi:hypothetical protein